jgi:DNA-binding transcriptional LysR family regulator
MTTSSKPTLDQLEVFVAAVEMGSFTAAGKQLGRATSAISYSIANLECQLGVALFNREGIRKPTLTDAGLAVLSEARAVSHSIDTLHAKVKGLLGGLESDVCLAVDVLLPNERLVDALRAFEAEFPTVGLRLHVEALGAVAQRIYDGSADIGICGGLDWALPRIDRQHIGGVELIPVAAPSHPLARFPGIAGAARNHVQLVLIDRSTLTEGRDFGVIAHKSWRLADLGSKHALLLAGVGWGNMPEPMVRCDIEQGRLVKLDFPEWTGGFYKLQAIYRTDAPPGPAAAWMIRRFAQQ